jgi:hypothetical protein
MSDREDTTGRPWDPAGTQPKHDPRSLLPERREPLLPPDAVVVDSDAVDEDGGDLLPERHAPGGAPAKAGAVAAPRHSKFAPRFQFITGALIAVAVAAIAGIALVVFGTPSSPKGPAWSGWKPTSGGVDGANQIASHVSQHYRDDGTQLVNVQTNGMSYKGIPLTVALREAPESGGNIQIHDDKGILYQMCGLGPNCSIDHGKPSKERTFLLRREALELSLYSLRYLGVKQVVVLLPPPPGRLQTIALYFRKTDVEPELNRPLRTSLVPRAPSVKKATLSPDATLVDQATDDEYVFSLMGSSFNDHGFLVLDPYSAETDDKLQKQLRQQAAEAAAAVAGAQTGATGG